MAPWAVMPCSNTLPAPFTLTARAENFIAGNPDLKDTIRRLQAFQEAGADVLYAPGLKSKEDIAAVLSAVGGALSRAALTAFLHAAQEMQQHGTFTFGNDLVPYKEINDMFEP
jgi:2-methylisocitrate lyase-like PEP mutase family enzyme